MEKYVNEQHFDFSGAVNQAAGRLLLADNEVNWIENGELEQIGPITKVRGYTQRGPTVNNTYNILGMINAYRTSDGVRKQIVICDGASNSDAYTYNPTNNTWTPHNLSLTSGAKAEFESFLNGFFMVNFQDATRFNNLTQWYTTTNVTGAAKAKYIKQYMGRLYLGYVVTGGSTFPSKVTYSNLPDTTVSPMTLSWNDTLNYFDVAADDGDVIMALEVNANRLLVFKQESLYRYDTNTLYQVPGCPGTTSTRSVRNIQGRTIYLHSTGLWSYDGNSSTIISRKIKDIIDGISTKNLNNANAWVKNDNYYIYVGNINNTKTGLTINKCLINYDIGKQSFTWRSLQDTPLVWMTYPDDTANITYNLSTLTYNDTNTQYNAASSAEQRTFFGTDTGKVMWFDTGRNFNGTDIAFSIETKDYYLGYPAFWKLLQKVILFTDFKGRGLIIQAKLDDGDWITLRNTTKRPEEFIFPSGSLCKRVRFRLQESSSGDRFSFEGLDIYYTAQGLLR